MTLSKKKIEMIHSLRKEGKSLREIADTLKISKGATAKYDKLDSDGPECNTQYQYRRIPAQRQPFYIFRHHNS